MPLGSRKIISLATAVAKERNYFIRLNFLNFTSGPRHMVKTYGAELRPSGSTGKQKYRTVPKKILEKPKNNLVIQENINIIISSLKIKTANVIAFVNI